MATTKNAKQTKQSKKESTEIKQTWNEISGVMRIYGNTFTVGKGKDKKDITKWSVSIGTKTDDGFKNFYMPVVFAKDATEPENDGLQTITIERAFLSVNNYTNKAGEEVNTPVIIVMENEVEDSDDLPF